MVWLLLVSWRHHGLLAVFSLIEAAWTPLKDSLLTDGRGRSSSSSMNRGSRLPPCVDWAHDCCTRRCEQLQQQQQFFLLFVADFKGPTAAATTITVRLTLSNNSLGDVTSLRMLLFFNWLAVLKQQARPRASARNNTTKKRNRLSMSQLWWSIISSAGVQPISRLILMTSHNEGLYLLPLNCSSALSCAAATPESACGTTSSASSSFTR